MTNTFPKPLRLSSKKGIERLHKTGKHLKAEGLTFRFLRNELPFGRLLIAAPKRFCKLSVDRNRLKRLIREVFRTNRSLLSGYDVKVSLSGKINGEMPSYTDIQKAVVLAAKSFHKYC